MSDRKITYTDVDAGPNLILSDWLLCLNLRINQELLHVAHAKILPVCLFLEFQENQRKTGVGLSIWGARFFHYLFHPCLHHLISKKGHFDKVSSVERLFSRKYYEKQRISDQIPTPFILGVILFPHKTQQLTPLIAGVVGCSSGKGFWKKRQRHGRRELSAVHRGLTSD